MVRKSLNPMFEDKDNKVTIFSPKQQTKYKNKTFKINPDFIHNNNKHNII